MPNIVESVDKPSYYCADFLPKTAHLVLPHNILKAKN